jgi:hypothetical protein
MKRVAYALTLVFAPLIAVGCDTKEPPQTLAPAQPDAPPPAKGGQKQAAPRKKKQPGLHSPLTPTSPRAKF